MDFLRSLWPNSSSNVITIPQHTEGELEDELDLKIKSLVYLFKRLNIENIPSFINDENGIYNFDLLSDNITLLKNDKLDAIYNKAEFERQLCDDEHRILIDWFKNKFRSICILSDDIPANLVEDDITLGKGFRFQVLKSSSTDDEIIDGLINSDLYIEHQIDKSTKINILKDILKHQRGLKPSFKKEFNKNDRAKVILQYLWKLSEYVQIERIYKATLIKNIESFRNTKLGKIQELTENNSLQDQLTEGSRLVFPNNTIRSRSGSPIRSRRPSNDSSKASSTTSTSARSPKKITPLSPVKLNSIPTITKLEPSNHIKISPINSPTRSSSRSNSPTRSLKKKQSMTIFKIDKSLEINKENEEIDGNIISKDELINIRNQSEQAVFFRIERERKILRSV